MIYLIDDKVQLIPHAYTHDKPIGVVEGIENAGAILEKISVLISGPTGSYKTLVSPDSLMLISRELVDRSSLTIRHINAYIEMGWTVTRGFRQLIKCSKYITSDPDSEDFVVYETKDNLVLTAPESMFLTTVLVEPTPNEIEYSIYVHKESGKLMTVDKKSPGTALVNSDSYQLIMSVFVTQKDNMWGYKGCQVSN